MPDGLAVPLFYLLAVSGWFFWRVTTARERASLWDWCWIGIVCFGGAGLIYTLLTGGSVAPTGGL